MINEATTGVAAFENGEIDIQADLPVADMDRLKTLPEYQVFPMLGVYYMGFNVEAKPLDNVDVRKALSLAIDRQSIVDNVTKAGQVPATGFIPEGHARLRRASRRTSSSRPRRSTRPRSSSPRPGFPTARACLRS